MKKIWILSLIFLAACAPDSVVPSPTITDSDESFLLESATIPVTRPLPTPTTIDTPLPTSEPTDSSSIILTQTPVERLEPTIPPSTSTPIPTPTPNYYCPDSGTAEANFESSSINLLKSSILGYLNAGGGWDELVLALEEQDTEVAISEVDFNGDEVDEVVLQITIHLPDYVTDAATWVVQCINGAYRIRFEKWWGTYHRNEKIVAVTDLDSNGYPDVVIEHYFSGSACNYELTIIGWNQSQGFVDYSPSHLEEDIGCPGTTMIEDIDGDNVMEIITSGDTVLHLSYAYPREIVQIFKLIDQSYQLVETEYSPSNIRFHVLDDAQRALDSGDLLLAIDYYDQAAHDESLENYPSKRFPPDEAYVLDQPEIYQPSFALFRLAVIHSVLGNNEALELILAELDLEFPEDGSGGEFTVLAHLFVDQYELGLTATEACQKVTEKIQEDFSELEAHIGDWGANISARYIDETICPVLVLDEN